MRQIYLAFILVLSFNNAYAQAFYPPVGSAVIVTPGEYNLTPSPPCSFRAGAVWCTTTIDFNNSFILTFKASFDHAVGIGADGMSVDFGQNFTATSINATNAYLGYYNTIGGPVNPDFNQSFCVEFDVFDNTFNPAFISDIAGTDHTAICPNAVPTFPCPGGGPAPISPTTTNVKDGLFHDYKIEWCPFDTSMKVYFDGSLRLNSSYDYRRLFTTPAAIHWGFSGGTGAYCSNHIIKNIVLTTGATAVTTSRKDTSVCATTPITLSAPTSASSYLWNTGATSSSISVGASGVYWVSTPLASGCGIKCDTFHVNFGSTFPVSIGNDTTICTGNSINISVSSVPAGSTILWNTGATTPSITVYLAGKYWAVVTNGSCIGADTMNLMVNPVPTVNLGPDKTICANNSASLQSSVSYSSPSYSWSTGATTASISVNTTGTYILTVTDGGCTGLDSINIAVKPVPEVLLYDAVICEGNSITLAVSQPPGTTYLWSTGSTDSAISVSSPGVYSITVTLNGCTASKTVTVKNDDSNITPVNIGPDTTLCIGETLVLNANHNNAIWCNNKTGPTISVSFPGTYWVSVSQPCGMVRDTINVDFHNCNIGFPNAFTPNGDGKNDIIRVVGTLQHYTDYSMSLYNRWGERVFYTEDIYAGWDGIYKGTDQDLGTYYYMIFYTFQGYKHMMKGDFTLIR